jgi:DNA-binding HxlR family transcriptional regulator
MKLTEVDRLTCPVARTLAVIGDTWTLLIVKECFLGTRRFEDFADQLQASSRIVADRLAKLTAAGILERTPYGDHAKRYEYKLTDKGIALYPVIVSIVQWGDRWASDDGDRPLRLVDRETGRPVEPVLTGAGGREALDPRRIRPRMSPAMADQRAHLAGGGKI